MVKEAKKKKTKQEENGKEQISNWKRVLENGVRARRDERKDVNVEGKASEMRKIRNQIM